MTTTPVTPGRLVGQRVKRREDPRLIQGRATYVDDIKLVGMLHMAVRRSDVAHGNIRSIDIAAAERMHGVVAVLTGAQLKELTVPMPVGTPFPAPDHYPAAFDSVRYVGEPVAVVVAADRYQARDAADAIVVDIEELPALVDPRRAMDDGAPRIHEDFANNIAVGDLHAGTGTNPETGAVEDDTALDAAFANAEVVVSQRMHNQRLIPTAMETRGCLAHFERAKAEMTFWSSTQNPHTARLFLSAAVGLGEHQVRVIAPEVGGGFGAKINVYGEDFIAAALSKRLDAPIKWIEDRSEAYLATTHGRDIHADVDIAANRDGKVLGVKYRLIADIGAYEMLVTAIVPTLTNFMLSGVYDIPVIRSDLTEVFTNKTPVDAYRGAGRPEGIYFIERAMDMLAAELQIDPAEIRRRNFFQPSQFPVTTQTGMVYDSGDYEMLLNTTLQNAGWDDLKARRDSARAEGRVVGLGMAYYVEICGLGPSSIMPTGGWEHAGVSVERTGTISVTTGASAHGQGHETTFAQMISDQFGGVPLERIRVLHGDTSIVKAGVGTFGSRSQAVGGTALMKAGDKVKAKMARFAAHMMEAKPEDIVFGDGRIFVKDVPESSLTFEEVAAYAYVPITLPRDTEPGLSDEAFWEPEGMTFPYGCYIALVEIDRDTGELSLLRWVGVDDCGNIINPLIVDGQLHGGIAQGIGQALTEEAVYDDNGQPLTGSLMDYAIPRASDLPRFELSTTVTPTPLNPMGAKGVGEAGTIGSTPALVNATVDALAPFGVKHVDMMLRPEKLWRLMQGENG